jgi:hypothetical protein
MSTWQVTTRYPVLSDGSSGIEGQSCVTYFVYVYCIGGTGNDFNPVPDVKYGNIDTQKPLQWKTTTSYPILSTGNYGIVGESCVAQLGYVFCLGGYDFDYNLVSDAFYAPISNKGVGSWQSTTPYPISVEAPSCVSTSKFVYCVGGYAGGGSYISSSYYASLTSSGIGAWHSTTSYPTLSTGNPGIAGQSCKTFGQYIYCIGGEDDTGTAVSDVFYAHISSSGIGTWTSSTSYPIAATSLSCATLSSAIYCVGGLTTPQEDTNAVYHATMSSTGIHGAWHALAHYPRTVDSEACVVSPFKYLYCVGGVDANLRRVLSEVAYLAI